MKHTDIGLQGLLSEWREWSNGPEWADQLQPFLDRLKGLEQEWRKSRAHTYCSENADHYRGFDAGQLRAAEALHALIYGPGQSGKGGQKP